MEILDVRLLLSASEMTYIVSSGALNSTHSLTHLGYYWPRPRETPFTQCKEKQ